MKWITISLSALLSYTWLWLACSLFLAYAECIPSYEITTNEIRQLSKPIKWVPIHYLARVTYYCSCTKCTKGLGITKSGTIPVEGITAACDSKLLGKHVNIQGLGSFRCEDIGSNIRGSNIDLYVQDHDTAKSLGKSYRELWFR